MRIEEEHIVLLLLLSTIIQWSAPHVNGEHNEFYPVYIDIYIFFSFVFQFDFLRSQHKKGFEILHIHRALVRARRAQSHIIKL